MKRFIFLEFTNPKVRGFLTNLREVLEGVSPPLPAHITVRGPYQEVPSKKIISKLNEEIQGHGVVIGGSGIFPTKWGFSVYLKVQSPVFDALWWKPDFPKGEFDIKPHITVFETVSSESAKEVHRFLRSERLEIFTLGLQLSIYSSAQRELFYVDIDPLLQKKRSEWERWRVRPGLLNRARQVREALIKIENKVNLN